jgi:dihydroorotate dehydrogenase (fumarate)
MSRLSTTYLGLELRTPLVASAGPLTRDPRSAVRLQEGGASAVVLPSLFEEEIIHEQTQFSRALDVGSEIFAEALHYFPDVSAFVTTGDRYLESIQTMKAELDIPVIGSLNATSLGGWARYARQIEAAGADALELNLYRIATDAYLSGSSAEGNDIGIIREVKESIGIPLSVKLSPYYTTMACFARQATMPGGADGLVLFNRFYQPELDPDTREAVPRVELSQPWELRLPVMWTAILRSRLPKSVSLAVTTGVYSGRDAAKGLLAGADAVMMCAAPLLHGPHHFATVERELEEWMDRNEYDSVEQLKGSASYLASDNPGAWERANYVRTLHSYTTPDLL